MSEQYSQLVIEDAEEYCREIINKFPQYIELHRQGGAALSFLVTQVLKESHNTCESKLVYSILKRMIEEEIKCKK